MRGWKRAVFAMEIRRITAYRADFWVNFLGQTGFALAIAYFLWSSIFATLGARELNGFTMKKMVIYYLLVPLVLRVQQGQSIGSISREIYEGTLNKFLLYPINFFVYKVMAHIASAAFYIFQIFFVLALWKLFVGGESVFEFGILKALYFVSAMAAVSVVYFFLNSLSELIAFWAEYIWSLGVMLRFSVSFLGGALIPLGFFPEWSVQALKYTPFPYMVSFPMRVILEDVKWETFVFNMTALSLWGAVFAGCAALIWKAGKYRYSGVGI